MGRLEQWNLDSGNYYDISPLVGQGIGVYDGDVPYQRDVSMSFPKGNHLTLSSIKCTLHLGAHVDAPIHYHPEGETIENRPLSYYFGPCEVVDVTIGRGERIRPEHLRGFQPRTERVLFKTETFPNPNEWNENFAALSPELIDFLSIAKVRLVGIDTPSVDLCNDKGIESHKAIFKNDMAVLEGIRLHDVPAGRYQLVALPLKLQSADASPVRAILISEPSV